MIEILDVKKSDTNNETMIGYTASSGVFCQARVLIKNPARNTGPGLLGQVVRFTWW